MSHVRRPDPRRRGRTRLTPPPWPQRTGGKRCDLRKIVETSLVGLAHHPDGTRPRPLAKSPKVSVEERCVPSHPTDDTVVVSVLSFIRDKGGITLSQTYSGTLLLQQWRPGRSLDRSLGQSGRCRTDSPGTERPGERNTEVTPWLTTSYQHLSVQTAPMKSTPTTCRSRTHVSRGQGPYKDTKGTSDIDKTIRVITECGRVSINLSLS